jgi:DNA repair exonuclease SbcCD ATPase subunit
MISFNIITIRNFLSVGAVLQTIVLTNAPLTLVLGCNMDMGGENNRNGAGKTTLLQAICYVLYGEPLTKIKVDNLVNSINGQGMQVSIEFTRDGVPYRIERGRKPNALRFLVGTEQIDYAKGKNEHTQIEIERVIGMSHTMFLHIVALNTFTIPFLKMRPADQREVIEELMGITQISLLAEQLKIEMDVTKEGLRDEEAMIKASSDANMRINLVIEQTRQRAAEWTEMQETLLIEIGDRANKLLEIDITAELAVFDRIDEWTARYHVRQAQLVDVRGAIDTMEHDISRLHVDLARYDEAAIDDESAEIRCMRDELSRLRGLGAQLITPQVDRLLAQAERQRQTAVIYRQHCNELWLEVDAIADQDNHQCSMCGQGLDGTDHLAEVLATLKQKKLHLAAQIERILTEIDQCEADSVASEAEADTLRQNHAAQGILLQEQVKTIDNNIILAVQRNADYRKTAATQAAQMRIQITIRQSELDEQYQTLDRLGKESHGDSPISRWSSREALYAVLQEREKLIARLDAELCKTNPLQDKIDGLTSTLLMINYDLLNDLTIQFKHEQFLYKLLTSKDSFIRKRIIDQNLSYLNRCLNKYLERLGLPHEVRFMPDLGVEITHLGQDFDFEQLSRGEMNRLILATSWSFRNLWENLNHPVNLLFMDEILDSGTDKAGIQAAVEVLMEIALQGQKNIFLISHREELKSQIDTVLLATKEDQFTSFEISSDQ